MENIVLGSTVLDVGEELKTGSHPVKWLDT
jgi:hypothetical protein